MVDFDYNQEPIRTIKSEVVDKISNPDRWIDNTLWKALKSHFSEEQLYEAFRHFYIGTSQDGSCVFWQLDEYNKAGVRTGKVISYKLDGHRDKDKGMFQVHTRKVCVNCMEYTFKPCLFGLHQVEILKYRPIHIVESEKTAVVMSILYPNEVWMATGGKSNLKLCRDIASAELILHPDVGAEEFWIQEANKLKLNYNLMPLEGYPEGFDLADVVLK